MGIFDSILAQSSEVDADKLARDFGELLIKSEKVEKAFKLANDICVFTNRRLILLDKQGLTGKRKTYLNIPYHSIDFFEIETVGHADLDAEVRLFLSGNHPPVVLEFKGNEYVYELMRLLGTFVL